MEGVYLKSPHGELIAEGRKRFIVRAEPDDALPGKRVIVSKVEGKGLAFGVAEIAAPGRLPVERFNDAFDVHCVTTGELEKWWPDADALYLYPITAFTRYPAPRPAVVAPGTQLLMPDVVFTKSQAATESVTNQTPTQTLRPTPPCDIILPDEVRERSEPTSPKLKEVNLMPWTASDASRFTESADTPKKARQWAEVANSALESCMEGKSGDEAVKKCEASAIRQANSVVGKSKQVEKAIETIEITIASLEDELILGTKADTCTCPNCGTEADKDDDAPCNEQTCDECGSQMRGGESDAEKAKDVDTADTSTKTDSGRATESGDAGAETPKERQESNASEVTTPTLDVDELASRLVKAMMVEAEAQKAKDEAQTDAQSIIWSPEGKERITVQPLSDAKAGRRIRTSKLEALKAAFEQIKTFLTDLISWGDYADKLPDIVPITSFKTFTSRTDPTQTYLMLWVTNSYKDREGEIFREAALKDFVAHTSDSAVKGEFWYRHIPGTKFGTVRWQSVVADRFLVQLGTFDDTPLGHAFKSFFTQHPDGHTVFAPTGWGASHGYNYIDADRQDGVYNWLRIAESSVLPALNAANVYNPSPIVISGGKQMNENEKAELAAIGKEVGADLVALVTETAEQQKAALDDTVDHKSVEAEPQTEPEPVEQDAKSEQVDDAGSAPSQTEGQETEAKSTKAVVEQIATAVAEALDLSSLSDTLTEMKADNEAIKAAQSELTQRMAKLETADEQKIALKASHTPRGNFMWNSRAAESVLTPEEQKTFNADIAKAPAAVRGITKKMLNQ